MDILNLLIRFFLISMIFFLFSCGNKGDSPQKQDAAKKKIAAPQQKIESPAEKSAPNTPDIKSPSVNPVNKEGASEPKTEEKTVEPPSQQEQPVAKEEGANEKEEEAGDAYDPTGKIDPFAPLIVEKRFVSVQQEKKKRRTHLTPLEKVDLSQLTLSAIVLASSGNRAIVTESDGKGYVVTIGTYIGINSGRVSQILRDSVIVDEEVENLLGKVSIRKRELKLQKPPGE